MYDNSIVPVICSVLAALISFIISYKISNFFIAPREHWRHSRWDIILLKLGMSAGAAYLAFTAVVLWFASK
jgi:hypothetical protein